MRAPRVKVGVLSRGKSAAPRLGQVTPYLPQLPELLRSCGHDVMELTTPQEIPHPEVIFVQAEGEALRKAIEEIAPDLRSGQIVIHTSLADGITALDAAEICGAVVICAYPVAPDLWVTTTLDELGATVAELFFGGMGARVVPLADEHRPDFLAAFLNAQAVREEYAQAAECLSRYLPDSQAVASLLTPPSWQLTAPDLHEAASYPRDSWEAQ